MTIFGVALLAICTLLGHILGELLGAALGVKSDVGGVGIAMILLISARIALSQRGRWAGGVERGVTIWGTLYIPIVVAMAAQQNVAAALEGGPMIVIGGFGVVALCFAMVGLIGRFLPETETMDEIEAREAREAAIAQPMVARP